MTKFGLQLWSQRTDWPGFRDAGLAAEEVRRYLAGEPPLNRC